MLATLPLAEQELIVAEVQTPLFRSRSGRSHRQGQPQALQPVEDDDIKDGIFL
jgi:hypothetical protein